MATNRRAWLKQAGLGIAGIGLAPINSFALTSSQPFTDNVKEDRFILLRSNENPYGPSPLAKQAMSGNLNISNRYHWDITAELISTLAEKNKVTAENILLGAGSTEILDLVARYAAVRGGSYVLADPSYDFWTAILDNMGLEKIKIPLNKDKQTDLNAMRQAIKPDTRLIYICNPNNPTGTICEREPLIRFIGKIPKNIIILVDEAYLEFSGQQSLCDIIDHYPNLVIARTFSKIYGMAGARIGYAIANSTTAEALSRLQSAPNSNVSVVSRVAAIASLKDDAFIVDCYTLNEKAKRYTCDELKKLNLDYISSYTNFIYFSLAGFTKDYFRLLEDSNILGTKIYEEQGDWTRITIGTMEEMKKFADAIR